MADNDARVKNREAVTAAVEGAFADLDSEEVLAKLSEAGIPAGVVRTLDEVYEWDQALSQGLKITVDHPVVGDMDLAGPVLRFFDGGEEGEVETTFSEHKAPPVLNADSEAIRAWLDGEA